MHLTQDMQMYLSAHQDELRQLIRDLCAIPAPSHREERRAAFCKRWFEENGGTHVVMDSALNVLCPYRVTEDNDVVVFMAHTDTVFPDMERLPLREDDGKYFCPGVCDDTANLAVLMLCARYVLRRKPDVEAGMVFVANSCEEGLGNLKGSRAIADLYGRRMRELITFDGFAPLTVVTRAVGSHRYRVAVRAEGGHSFGDFGNRNAIRYLASMIDTLYSVKAPQDGTSKTTYNVGIISGGTSVNTIAELAEMLYEYRSDSLICLEKMKRIFDSVIETYRAMGMEVICEMIGDRPCAGEVDPRRFQTLLERVGAAVKAVHGQEMIERSGSTDCNIPLSRGIPAVCISVCSGGRAHSRDEYLELDSLLGGCRVSMELMASYFME